MSLTDSTLLQFLEFRPTLREMFNTRTLMHKKYLKDVNHIFAVGPRSGEDPFCGPASDDYNGSS